MAKPRFIFTDKKTGRLIYDTGPLGKIAFKDERKGAAGTFKGVGKLGNKEFEAVSIDYTVIKNGNEMQVRPYMVHVRTPHQGMNLATIAKAALESSFEREMRVKHGAKTRVKMVSLDQSQSAASVSAKLGHKIERDSDGFWSWRNLEDVKRWKKVPLTIKKQKKIRRR